MQKNIYQKSDINEKFDDYITYLIIGIILGGRIGYILFYNFSYYLENFLIFLNLARWDVISWWFIRVIVSSYIFAKKNNQNSFFI